MDVSYDGDSSVIAVGCGDGVVRLVDATPDPLESRLTVTKQLNAADSHSLLAVAYHPSKNPRYVVSGSNAGVLRKFCLVCLV